MSEMNLTSPDSRRRVSDPAKQPFDPDPEVVVKTCADTGDEVGDRNGDEAGDETVIGDETGDETVVGYEFGDVNLEVEEPKILL